MECARGKNSHKFPKCWQQNSFYHCETTNNYILPQLPNKFIWFNYDGLAEKHEDQLFCKVVARSQRLRWKGSTMPKINAVIHSKLSICKPRRGKWATGIWQLIKTKGKLSHTWNITELVEHLKNVASRNTQQGVNAFYNDSVPNSVDISWIYFNPILDNPYRWRSIWNLRCTSCAPYVLRGQTVYTHAIRAVPSELHKNFTLVTPPPPTRCGTPSLKLLFLPAPMTLLNTDGNRSS